MSNRVELELRVRLPLSAFALEVDLVESARSLGVFGPSGAGKSSLLEVIAGLRPATTGRVRFGNDVWLDTERGVRLPAEARDIGFVPQASLLFPHLDVRGNLRFGAARGRSRGGAAERLESVAEMLEIGDLLERSPRDLSGGEQKRVALGRALCSGPRLLLLDEPFAGLDLKLRQRLRGLLRRVVERLELPLILVSHEPPDIQALCHAVVALDRGRVIGHGAPSRVLSDSKVIPLAGTQGYENVFEAQVVGHEARISRVRVGNSAGPELLVPRCEAAIGERALLGLRAQDVLVATGRPEGLSARNVVPVTVEEVSDSESGVLVRLRLGPDTVVVAELTEGALNELELTPGKGVFLVAKTQSFSVVA